VHRQRISRMPLPLFVIRSEAKDLTVGSFGLWPQDDSNGWPQDDSNGWPQDDSKLRTEDTWG
jgi:hypothetical protein